MHNVATLYSVHHDLHSLFVCLCLFVYFVSHMQCTFPVAEPGVPYNVIVSATTSIGKGEPVSIDVFSVEQGKIDCRPCTKNCDVHSTELLKILYYAICTVTLVYAYV